MRVASGPHTLVAFHAHPDDEALLTGGTLARAAAEGHRVVLVTATDGERGLAGREDGHGARLAAVRVAELEEAAAALGVARLVRLGYGDSGLHADPTDATAFANVDPEAVATRLASLLREEQADVLVVYDRNGGYGHPDHVQVHRVGSRAAVLAGTPVVLEATVPADLYRGVLRVLRAVGHALGSSAPLGTERVFSPRSAVTHRIRFPHQVSAKRAAMAAHGSQRRAEGQTRVLDLFLRLPDPVFALVFGREWFAQQGLRRSGRVLGDVFAGLPDE
jgi:LmbE family N-acetylglucosaminyl deacetylase